MFKRLCLLILPLCLLVAQSASAATIISNNFDGDDGNDTGGLFNVMSNNLETSDTTNASTGVVSFATSNAVMGFSSSSSFDAQAFSSLTVTWTIASVAAGSGNANGWFFGLQSAQGINDTGTTLWNQLPNAIGVNMFGTTGASGGTIVEDNPTETRIDVTTGGNGSADAAVADGFTVSLTLNDDNTYTISSTGLTNDFDQNLSGAFPGDFVYSQLGSTTFATATLQRNTGAVMTVQVDSVTVTGVPVPEPSSLLLLGVASLGLLGAGRRRK